MRAFLRRPAVITAICSTFAVVAMVGFKFAMWAFADWLDYQHSPQGFAALMVICVLGTALIIAVCFIVDRPSKPARGLKERPLPPLYQPPELDLPPTAYSRLPPHAPEAPGPKDGFARRPGR
jgi:hypothetical protein